MGVVVSWWWSCALSRCGVCGDGGRGGVCVILSGIRAIWASTAWEEELVATARNSGGDAGNSIRYLVHLINGGKNMSFAIKKMKR